MSSIGGDVLKFIELNKHILQGNLKSAYVVSGDDPYIVRSALSFFATLAGNMKELNISKFGSNDLPENILPALLTPPLMSDYRVVFVESYSKNTDWVVDYLSLPCPTTILVFHGNLSPTLSKVLSKIEIVDCNRLSQEYLSKWIINKASSKNTSIDSNAATLLAEYCNRDMFRISSELIKLSDYAQNEPITVNTIKSLVVPDLEYKIYHLSEAITQRKKDRAVALLQNLLAENNSAVSLLAMLFNHFRKLLMVAISDDGISVASDLKVSESSMYFLRKQAKTYSVKTLKTIFDKLCELDANIKNGRILEKTALILFVCEISSCAQ